MKQKKYNKKKYNLGSFVQSNTGGLALAGNTAGQLLGDNSAGDFLSGAGSGLATGASIGSIVPGVGTAIGAGVGALIGGIGSVVGGGKRRKAEREAKRQAKIAANGEYIDGFNSMLDTNNENPYGNIYQDGGIVTKEKRDLWNNYVDYLNTKGLKGSKDLDNKDTQLSRKVFDEYTKANKLNLKYDEFIPEIQRSISTYRNAAINKINSGEAVYTKPIDTFMQGLSTVDGWAGSKTTSWKFPSDNLLDKNTKKPIGKNSVYQKFADGGDIFPNTINIELGELQIDPATGKILREYDGINPETGGKYQPHSKGKDTKHNIVSAEEGSFIITKALSKDYKNAVDNNDKLHKESILMNIRNAKDKKDSKYKYGSYVKYASGGDLGTGFSDWNKSNQLIDASGINMPSNKGFSMSQGLNTLTQLAPSLINIGKGLFGKTEVQAPIKASINPFQQNVLNNMPQDVNINPLLNDLRISNNATDQRLRNNTSSSSIYRANRLQQDTNYNRTLGNIRMQEQQANNQIRGQRAGIYNQLGSQAMNEQARVQQTNLGIDQINAQNRAAKSNLLATGLGQLQQTIMNNNTNSKRSAMEEMQMKLMMEMFPNMKFYSNLFNQ